MKKLLILTTVLVLGMVSASAQLFYGTNNLAATNNTIFSSGAVVLQKITLWSTNTSPTLVYLRDGDLVSTNSAFTNYLTYTTNVVTTWVGTQGTTNNYTNTVVTYIANNVAASTNNAVPARFTFVVPASPTILNYTFVPNQTFVNKLTLSNSVAGVNALIQYRNP